MSPSVAHVWGVPGVHAVGCGVIFRGLLPEIFRYDPFLAVTGAALPRSGVGQTAVATTYQLTR